MRNVRLALLTTISLLLTGCDQNMTDLYNFVNSEKQKKQGHVEPIPEFKTYQSFAYDATNLRSPFLMTQEDERSKTNSLHPDRSRQKEALEFFELDSMRMVGVIEQDTDRWGLIRDAEGTIHRIKPGNYAGTNYGKIKRISDTEIQLTELIRDSIGNWIQRPATLMMDE